MSQDNNEAASAPAAFADYMVKNYPAGTVIGDPLWHVPRIYRAAIQAASASQSSTPVPRVGGNTSEELPASVERRVQYIMDAVKWYADHKDESTRTRIEAMVTELESIAHVAHQRQESTSEYSQVSSEHSAAVAEGVDTALPRADLSFVVRGIPRHGFTAAKMQEYGAQQREAGRREKQAEFDAIFDAFGIGSEARTCSVLMANLRNTLHFANLLHAVEREFFMVPGEPDEDHPDEAPGEECMLNCWGSTVEQYIEQFRSALAALARQPVSEGLTLPKVFGVSRDAESPGGKCVLVSFHRALTDDELRAFHDRLSAVPPAKAEGMSEKLESIAESWDGCMYEAVGETLDIGAVLRNQFVAILAQQAKKGGAA